MLKLITKVKQIGFCVTLMALAAGSGIYIASRNVNLSVYAMNASNGENVTFEEGASVRTDAKEDGVTGIRFKATIKKDVYDSLIDESGEAFKSNCEAGMIIVPAYVLTNWSDQRETGTADLFTYIRQDLGVSSPVSVTFAPDKAKLNAKESGYELTGVINLKETNYLLTYQAAAYYKTEDGTITYDAFSNERSLAYVADAALNDTTLNAPTEQQRISLLEKIKTITDMKFKKDGYDLTGNQATLTANKPNNIDLASYFSDITSSDKECVVSGNASLSEEGLLKISSFGSVGITVSAYGGMFSYTVNIDTQLASVENLVYDAATNSLSWNGVEGASYYNVKVQNVNGDVLLDAQNVNDTSYSMADVFSMGNIRFEVTPIAAIEGNEPFLGDSTVINAVVKNSDYLSELTDYSNGSKGFKSIVSFNDVGQENFIVDTDGVASIADGYLDLDFSSNPEAQVEYILPEPIDSSKIGMFELGFKTNDKNVNKIAVKLVGENGKIVMGYCEFANWNRLARMSYGMISTDLNSKSARFSIDSLLDSTAVSMGWHKANTWKGDTKIVKIVFSKYSANNVSLNFLNVAEVKDTCSFGKTETVDGNTVESIVDFTAGDLDHVIAGDGVWGFGSNGISWLAGSGMKTYGNNNSYWGGDFICPKPVAFGENDTLQVRFYCEKDENGNDKCSLEFNVFKDWHSDSCSETVVNSSGGKTKGIGTVTAESGGWYILSIPYAELATVLEGAEAITRVRFGIPTVTARIDWVKVVRTGANA